MYTLYHSIQTCQSITKKDGLTKPSFRLNQTYFGRGKTSAKFCGGQASASSFLQKHVAQLGKREFPRFHIVKSEMSPVGKLFDLKIFQFGPQLLNAG